MNKRILLTLIFCIFLAGAVSAADYRFQNSSGTNLTIIHGDSGNLTVDGNISTSNYGFFGFLGSTLSRISNFFATNADISNNLTVGGNLSVDTNTLFVDSNNNRVGIGTITPQGTFEVQGGKVFIGDDTHSTDNDHDVILFGDGSNAQAGNARSELKIFGGGAETRHLRLFQQDGGYAFITNTYEDMRIQPSRDLLMGDTISTFVLKQDGKLGIGTASPAVKFDVHGASEIVGSFGRANDATALIAVRTAETQNNRAGIGFTVGSAAVTGISSTVSLGDISAIVTNSGGALAADLAFSVNSGDSTQERMRILSGGNVGIGTASPGNNLEIEFSNSSTTPDPALRIHNTYNGATPGYGSSIEFGFSTDAQDYKKAEIRAIASAGYANDIDLTFWTGGSAAGDHTERMRLEGGTGNVGIGTASPSTTLTVGGVLNITDATEAASKTTGSVQLTGGLGVKKAVYAAQYRMDAGADIVFDSSTSGHTTIAQSSNDVLTFKVGGTDIMTLKPSNVGIGTASPSSYDGEGDDLVIFSSGTTPGITIATGNTGGRGSILFADGTSGAERYRGGITYDHGTGVSGSTVADSMYFRTAAAIRMSITGAGNVGIGTTSPTAKLDVNGTGDLLNISRINGTLLYVDGDSGNVGFGTSSPGVLLHVLGPSGGVGYARIEGVAGWHAGLQLYASGGASATEKWDLTARDDGSGGTLVFSNDNNERVTFAPGGNVGIGTVSPSSALHIQPEALATMDILTWDRGNTGVIGTIRYEDSPINMIIGTQTNHDFSLQSNNLTRMTIDLGGNVGIGTASPSALLEVVGANALLLSTVTNDAATPTLAFGDGNTGFYESADNDLWVTIGGTKSFIFEENAFYGSGTNSAKHLGGTPSSTTPGFAFNADEDTGLGRAGANITSLIAGGTNVLNALWNGKVGIGTTSPAGKLMIDGKADEIQLLVQGHSTQTNELVAFENSAGTNVFEFSNTGSLFVKGGDVVINNAKYLRFLDSGGTSRNIMTLNSNNDVIIDNPAGGDIALTTGNVGIGTTSPAQLFEVKGTTRVTRSATSDTYLDTIVGDILVNLSGFDPDGYVDWVLESNGAEWLGYDGLAQKEVVINEDSFDVDFRVESDGSTEALFVQGSSGNVGIGTTSPNGKLQIVNADTGSDLYGLSVDQNDPGNWGALIDGVGYGLDVIGPSWGLRVQSGKSTFAGNVGIGTTSPLDALNVQSAVSSVYRGNLLLQDSTALGAGVGGQITFGGKYTGSTYTEWAGIQGAKATATDGQYGGDLLFRTRLHGGALSTKVIIQDDGKVGIGTTSPDYELDVAGNIGIDQTIYHNGDADTAIHLITDDIQVVVGNVAMLRLLEGATDEVIVNEDGADVNLRVEASGEANALFVQGSSGNVGIGTGSPSELLEIDGGNFLMKTGVIKLNDVAQSIDFIQSGRINFDSNNDQTGRVLTFGSNRAAGAGGGTDIMTLEENGNVGIGTTNPSARFEVVDTGTVNAVNLSNVLYVDASNNRVGIGTASPQEELHLANNYKIQLGESSPLYLWGSGGSWNKIDSRDSLHIATPGGHNIKLGGDAGVPIVFLKNNDRVGIGTDSPGAFLDVKKDGLTHSATVTTAQLAIEGSGDRSIAFHEDGTYRGGIGSENSDSSVRIYSHNNIDAIVVAAAGNVGIGTSPGFLLDLLEDTANTDIGRFKYTSTNAIGSNVGLKLWNYDSTTNSKGGLTFAMSRNDGVEAMGGAISMGRAQSWTSSASTRDSYMAFGTSIDGTVSEKMRIHTNGKVGIGTASPAYTLDVNGVIHVATGGSASAPAISFGDGNTGFYESGDNDLYFTAGGVSSFILEENAFYGAISMGSKLTRTAAGSTVASFTFNGDEDTGLGRAGANITSLIAGGTNVLNALWNGNVGIGTTSPDEKLQVIGNNAGTDEDIITWARPDEAVGGVLGYDGTYNRVTIGAQTAHDIAFVTSSTTEHMTIKTDGKVGIGTASPPAGLTISGVSGHTRYTTDGWSRYLMIDSAQSGGGGIIWSKQSSTYNRAILVNQGSMFFGRSTADDNSAAFLPDMTIDPSGNVGIGTASPGKTLDVTGQIRASSAIISSDNMYMSGGQFYLGAEVTTTDGSWRMYPSGDDLLFQQRSGSWPTKFMIEDNTGNVGIGTASPSEKLHVVGASRFGNRIDIYAGGDSTKVANLGANNDIGLTGPSGNDFVIKTTVATSGFGISVSGDATTNFYIQDNGNVGIGTTSPGGPLDVKSGLAAASGIGATYVRIQTSTDSGRELNINLADDSHWVVDTGTYGLRLVAGATNEGISIAADGKVGIGTTSPVVGLHVSTSGITKSRMEYQSGSSNFGEFQMYEGTSLRGGIRSIASNFVTVARRLDTEIFSYTTGSDITFWPDNQVTFVLKDGGDVIGTHGNYHVSSDERLKENITTITNALDKVNALRGVNFNYIDSVGLDGIQSGFIAQEVEAAGFVGTVHTQDLEEDGTDFKSVQDGNQINAYLIEAIKELSAKVDALESA